MKPNNLLPKLETPKFLKRGSPVSAPKKVAEVPVLIEIVSAQITPADIRKVLNTYCVVKDLNTGGGVLLEEFPSRHSSPQDRRKSETSSFHKLQPKVIHKTKTIRRDNNPIWTVLTESLVLVHVSPDNLLELNEGTIEFELFHKDPLNVVDKSLGSVRLRKRTLLEGDGERTEYALVERGRGTDLIFKTGYARQECSTQNQAAPEPSDTTGQESQVPDDSDVTIESQVPDLGDTSVDDATVDSHKKRFFRGRLHDRNLNKNDQSFLNRSKRRYQDTKDQTSENRHKHGGIFGMKVTAPPLLQIPNMSGPMQGIAKGTAKGVKSAFFFSGKAMLGAGKAVQGVGSLLTRQENSRPRTSSTVVLRFRVAEPHEVQFMKNKAPKDSFNMPYMPLNLIPKVPFLKNTNSDEAVDTPKTKKVRMLQRDSMKKTIAKPLTQPMERGVKTLKKVTAGVVQRKSDVKFKVKPYPDPHNSRSTAWMTRLEIERAVLEPSRKWIQVGDCGNKKQQSEISDKEEEIIGTLRVEIIKCQDLPNTDTGAMGDLTDAFVAMVFENNVVRTDVVFDELSPRFMPWTQRAFEFSVVHPSSLLFLGVLDHDALGDFEQIGRVVVDLSKFKGGTEYLLNYKLHSNPDSTDKIGFVTIRLTIDWKSEVRAMRKALSPPTPMRINVADKKAFRVVRYLCR